MTRKKNKEYQNTRIWKDTLRKLDLVATAKGISIVELLDRLVNQEMPKAAESLYHEMQKGSGEKK